MSTVKTKFTLHENLKDFTLGVSKIEAKTLIPYTHRMHPITLILTTAFSIGMFLLILYGALFLLANELLFAHFSQVVDAQVIACEMEYTSKGGDIPQLTYSYIWNQNTFTDTDSMVGARNNQAFCEAQINKIIQIRVLTPNPERTQALLPEADILPVEGIIVIVFVLVALIAFREGVYESVESVMLHISAALAPKRLNRKGIILEGEITYILGFSSEPPKPHPYVVGVIYRFETPENQELMGYAEARRDDLKDSELPPIGSPIAVLYADDHAHMML